MSLTRWDRIHTVREAVSRPDLVCPETIFSSLRQHEARLILEALDVPIPKMPNTMMHSAMRKCFASLEPTTVHDHMVQTLKRTRNLSPISCLIDQLPTSLQPRGPLFPCQAFRPSAPHRRDPYAIRRKQCLGLKPMYRPYFRGKQYELITIRETADLLAKANFVPIIEPVKETLSGLTRALKAICDANGKVIVVVNPFHGDLAEGWGGNHVVAQRRVS